MAGRSSMRAELPDALVIGRLHADLYPREIGVRLEDVQTFERFVGGFGGNVAVGLARLGVRTAVVSGVGDDGLGRFVTRFLGEEAVDTTWVAIHPSLRTAITFCEIRPPDEFPLLAYRLPMCPDWDMTPDQLPKSWIENVPLLFICGTSLAIEPSRSTTELALRWRAEGNGIAAARSPRATVLDLDWRESYWPRPAEYPAAIDRILGSVDVVIGSDSEFSAARLSPEVLLDRGSRLVFVKHGPRGASVLTADSRAAVPGIAVEVLNGLGSGDAFAAAVGWGLLRGSSAAETLETANVAGSIVATRIACSAAMPTLEEIHDRRVALDGPSAAT